MNENKEKAQVRSYRVSEETNDKFKEIISKDGFPNQESALSAMIETYKLHSVSSYSEDVEDFSSILQRISELYRHAVGKAEDVKRTTEVKYKDQIERLEQMNARLRTENKEQEERLKKSSFEALEEHIFERGNLIAQIDKANERIKELAEERDKLLNALFVNQSPPTETKKRAPKSTKKQLKAEEKD